MKNTSVLQKLVCPKIRSHWGTLLSWAENVDQKKHTLRHPPIQCRYLFYSPWKLHAETQHWCLDTCPCKKKIELIAVIQISPYIADIRQFDVWFTLREDPIPHRDRRFLRLHFPWAALSTTIYGLTLHPQVFLGIASTRGVGCLALRQERRY